MMRFPQSLFVAILLAGSTASAATINFTGSIASLSQGFIDDGYQTGQPVSGSLTLTSAGPDFDNSSSVGFFILDNGSLQFSLNGIFQGNFTTPANVMIAATQDVAEGTDQLQLVVGLTPDSELNLVFLGTEAFLSSDAFPSAPGQINWAAFVSGTGTLSLLDNSGPVAGPGDSLSFDITGASDIPEPSTFVLAGCALAFIAWRRRA